MMGLLRSSFAVVLLLSLLEQSSSFVPLRRPSSFSSSSSTTAKLFAEDLNTDAVVSRRKTLDAAALVAATSSFRPSAAFAEFQAVQGDEKEGGGTAVENSKIRNGGASTINNQRGARKTITRGVQLDKADFAKEDLSGVSFQQSQVRNGQFDQARLVGTSFCKKIPSVTSDRRGFLSGFSRRSLNPPLSPHSLAFFAPTAHAAPSQWSNRSRCDPGRQQPSRGGHESGEPRDGVAQQLQPGAGHHHRGVRDGRHVLY